MLNQSPRLSLYSYVRNLPTSSKSYGTYSLDRNICKDIWTRNTSQRGQEKNLFVVSMGNHEEGTENWKALWFNTDPGLRCLRHGLTKEGPWYLRKSRSQRCKHINSVILPDRVFLRHSSLVLLNVLYLRLSVIVSYLLFLSDPRYRVRTLGS